MLFQICSNLQRAWNKLIVSPIKKKSHGNMRNKCETWARVKIVWTRELESR